MLYFLVMSILKFSLLTLAIACVYGWAEAQHVIVLKNGRQITVQNYRTEGSMIKFPGLGGEIAIPKDQIQSILKAGQSDRPGLSMSELETSPRQPAVATQKPSPPPTRDVSRPPSPIETQPTPDVDEAKEYQARLAEVTQKLEAAKEKYFTATQGGGTASNVTKEGLRSWTMDLASRIHDSQKVPGGGGPGSTPPTPPYAPRYTGTEKELSDLRIEIDRLQNERDSLIQEMKSKNIPIPGY
jgi:hypothetical protein